MLSVYCGKSESWLASEKSCFHSSADDSDYRESHGSDLLGPFIHTPPLGPPERLVESIASFYDAVTYAYCITDVARMFYLLGKMGYTVLLARPDAYIVSPCVFIRHPHMLPDLIGEERHVLFADAMRRILKDHDASAQSLLPCCHDEGASGQLLVPLLRGLCCCVAVNHPFQYQIAHIVDTVIHEGRIAQCVQLAGDGMSRAATLSRLLIQAAVEFGSERVLNAGLMLQRRAGVETDIHTCKSIALCVTREERRHLDWNVKSTAQGATLRRMLRMSVPGTRQHH